MAVRVIFVENMAPDADGLIAFDGVVTVVVLPSRESPNWAERVARVLGALLAALAARRPAAVLA